MIVNTTPTQDALAGLTALIARAGEPDKVPPVEAWEPELCRNDVDLCIKRDGLWYYNGTPIGRERLVKLFAGVLRKDPDGFTYLVTPVEKIRITVEDAPFLAVEVNGHGDGRDQVLTFRTNVGDVVEAGPEHPMRFVLEPETDGLKPYVHVRGRLEARAARPLLYELAELGCAHREEERAWFGVWSHGVFYPMAAMDDLEGLWP